MKHALNGMMMAGMTAGSASATGENRPNMVWIFSAKIQEFIMMCSFAKDLIAGVLVCLLTSVAHGEGISYPYTWKANQNPLITHVYTADPSAHVGPDGKLWLIPSGDVSAATDFNSMDNYHAFSTEDMETWTDHGVVFSSKDVSREAWSGYQIGSGGMWAPDWAHKDGTWYLYYPKFDAQRVREDGTFGPARRIGVATAPSPTGPYTDRGPIGGTSLIDPGVFLDEDGQAYLYWGGSGKFFRAKLKSNMLELDGEPENISAAIKEPFEGPFLWKRNGIYYLMYASWTIDGEPISGQRLLYGTLDSPMGNFTYRGVLMENLDVHPVLTKTSHGSVVEFKGRSYLFYHTDETSGNRFRRCVHVDEIHYNPDGTIQEVIPSVHTPWPWISDK